jgi:Xaa-Pro aminopeptidase
MPDFEPAQTLMHQTGIDAWLVHDFRGSSAVLSRLYPGPGGRKRHLTRRAMLLVPRSGSPTLLHSVLDGPGFADVPVAKRAYVSWQELHAGLGDLLAGVKRVAMEYSPMAALPIVGVVDAGTIELVRSLGPEVTSSADLIQSTIALWSEEAHTRHLDASCKVDQIKDEAFATIADAHSRGTTITEFDVQSFIMERFAALGLETPDPPIVAVNAHSGDPHFEVSRTSPSRIVPGDWVLIDLWARFPGDENIYSDVTWNGYCGRDVPARHREVFDAVLAARNASLALAKARWKEGAPVQGHELDTAARDVLIARGLAQFVRHRTGHSLSQGPMVHGNGMNLDSLETMDTRLMLPRIGFTIEPGAYLPEFGVRSEINVYVDPKKGPTVTSNVQHEPILMA